MKKTLIAAAIATVAAAPAMADVAVSGQVKVTVADVNGANTTGGSLKDMDPTYDNKITFKASEDLGNGLNAFAQITIDTDEDTLATTAGGSQDQKVGVSGSFGTVVLGRMETPTQGVLSAAMDDGGGNGNLETNLTNIGRVDAIAYVSPTVSGFNITAAGVMDGSDAGMTKHSDFVLGYNNGPLAIKLGKLSFDDTTDYDLNSLSVSYKIGDLKLSAMSVEKDLETGTDITDDMYRADYTIGNNTITVGGRSSDTADSDVTAVKLAHKLSGRTGVWVGHRSKDADNGTSANSDTTHFGMIHKF